MTVGTGCLQYTQGLKGSEADLTRFIFADVLGVIWATCFPNTVSSGPFCGLQTHLYGSLYFLFLFPISFLILLFHTSQESAFLFREFKTKFKY